MKKVLITGGSGFIGTNLVEALIAEDTQILNIDHTQPQIQSHLSYWKNIDILDYKELEKAMLTFNPDIIIHLAAITDLLGKDLNYYDTNVTGTKNIVEIAEKLPSLKKVIYTSSMYVCKPGFIPNDDITYKPHTVYGESKVLNELLIRNIKGVGYEWIIIRPSSIWGPWFSLPYIDFFNVVYKKRYFNFGGSCTKTYGYVENTVYQIIQLVQTEGLHGKIFYLGDLPPTKISEWANEISIEMKIGGIKKIPFFVLKIAALAGDLLGLIKIKFPLTSFRLSNMVTNNILPLTNTYEVCGQVPYTRLEGVKKTVAWMYKIKHLPK